VAKLNLTPERLKALDPKDMLGKTLELPKQIVAGMKLGRAFAHEHSLARPESVEWFGLGGSAIAGDVLQAMGYKPPATPMHMSIERYLHRVDSGTPRLICSYSGDTIEAVKAFEGVTASQIWMTMSSGGKIEALSHQAKVPHLKLPAGYPPRAALGFMLGAMIAVFEESLKCMVWEMPIALLEDDAQIYRALNPDENPALSLAVRLVDRTPVIYTVDSETMPAIAARFRTQLAENAKVWSHMAMLPEMAHNEVEAFPFLGQVLPTPLVILLGGWFHGIGLMDPRPALCSLMDTHSITHVTINPEETWNPGVERVEAVLRTLLFLDTVSVYLAILRAQDPFQIPVITKLKKATTLT
jgi:glucose/mannose-6-phosphate isomerase